MRTPTAGTSAVVYARVAALLYLLPFAPFSLVYVPSHFIVPGNIAATASTILASESFFRLGIVSNLLSQICMTFVSLLLYQLLKPVNKNMALLMVILNLLGVPLVMLNELNRFAILLVLGDPRLTVFTPNQLHALVSFFLGLHALGLNIADIFWGLWLLPMGYLVFKSGFLPRILGVLLMIACFGYLIEGFAAFLAPNLDVSIILVTALGEFFFALWLLIKGVNAAQWEKRALVSA